MGEFAEAHDQFVVIVLRGTVAEPHVGWTPRVRLHINRNLQGLLRHLVDGRLVL